MSSKQLDEKAAPSRQAVEEWLERVDDITAAVRDILDEDPMEAARKREEREERRRQTEANEAREKIKMRYDPRYYFRFENDEVIDKLLKEVDGLSNKNRSAIMRDELCYSRSERVSLEEARRLKDEAAGAVKMSDWVRALELYTSAIALNVVDDGLQRTLRNNRALVQLKLKHYLETVDDASYVLREEPTNVKALLRRATALRHLHRPLDALKDAETALQKEPTSQEAADLAHWLQRAKSEHTSCAAFQQHNSNEAKRLRDSVDSLTTTVTRLREIHAKDDKEETSSVENATDKEENEKKFMLQAAESVRQCLELVQSFHRGAAVLFTLSNGVNSLMNLFSILLYNCTSRCFGFLIDDGSMKLSTNGMTFVMSARLLAFILHESEVAADGLEPSSTIAEITDNLVKILKDIEHQYFSTNSASATIILLVAILQLLEALAVRFPFQVYTNCNDKDLRIIWTDIIKQHQVPQMLFFYSGLLEALFRKVSVSVALAKETEGLLLEVVNSAITSESVQLKEVGLSLALRMSCVSSEWAKAMSSPEFTQNLASLVSWIHKGKWDSSSPRLKEALYAVVYNVFLQVESRPQYVEQWRNAKTKLENIGTSSLFLPTWDVLREWALSDKVPLESVSVQAKMMGVLVKFSPYDESLRNAILKDEEGVWSLLDIALRVIEPAADESKTAVDEGEINKKAAWEMAEHVTTCIASFYSQNLLSREKGLSISNRIDTLMRIIQSAGNHHLVALGNAALTASFVPPDGYAQYAAFKTVDVLLKGLRDARELKFTLEHDGKRGNPQWRHVCAAQKNLGIALSRCCTQESQRERLRELKGFETLHAVLEEGL
ncbi:putative serine/threonine protein phosphatase type 5 [Trypanosoma theileri]|uniref:Putative serine/threonine protein phosphatase type 5 n=1 Tax=Trypanosoma theileri TaxID=67003 RepID=A0A1X0NKS2_9TRYP|nr:putative serine/threonine protein phosphatase type 5 [Trypanosoma theileri]ORC85181.1 putative serine/threonine protein phosphatase type 5 [Trypanosoma theileri]